MDRSLTFVLLACLTACVGRTGASSSSSGSTSSGSASSGSTSSGSTGSTGSVHLTSTSSGSGASTTGTSSSGGVASGTGSTGSSTAGVGSTGGSTGGATGGSTGSPIDVSTCSADFDCHGGEALLGLCNTAANVCIPQRCQQSSDCPSDQPSCIDFTDGGGDQGCACTTDALCLDGYLCNPLDRLCEAPCAQDSDCSVFLTPRACVGGLCLPRGDGGP